MLNEHCNTATKKAFHWIMLIVICIHYSFSQPMIKAQALESTSTHTKARNLNSPPELPTFKLPYKSNDNVKWTGGPHAYGNEGLLGTFSPGDGSGLDFSNGSHFEVLAMADGTVIEATCNGYKTFGCIIALRHDYGGSVMIYAHLESNSVQWIVNAFKNSQPGTIGFAQGAVIGKAGNSGSASFPIHLHIELRDGSETCLHRCLPGNLGGNPIGWDDLLQLVDGYQISGYYKTDLVPIQAYNYDGSAFRGGLLAFYGFPYVDVDENGNSVNRKVYARVDDLFTCSSNTNCEINGDPNAAHTTQFAGHGVFGGGGFENKLPLDSKASTINGGTLVSTNIPIYPPTVLPPNVGAQFIADITLPDGTVVSSGQALTKTWRVKNVGTSTWDGFKLKFVDGEQMGGPTEITIPTTAPGQTRDLSINIVAPSTSGAHSGSWQIVNTAGTWINGGKLWVTINVMSSNGGSGNITQFDVSPASPSSASSVHLVGRIKAFPDFRAMRFVVGDEVHEMTNFKQIGDQYEISVDWNTASLARGDYAIAFEVAKTGDPNWSNAERLVKNYTLTGTPASQNRPPDRPVLKSPYDWYLKDASGASASVELCVNPGSDPDGNQVQYWFEVKDQGGGVYATSGWSSNTCWTHTYAPNTYSWRVKTGDGSAESDWSSNVWHFSVAGGGVYIGSHSFFDLNTDNTHLCVFVTYDGIQGPDVRAWINEATDGSESGAWRLLDHYGPNTTPDCTQSNYHGFWIRSTKYETGNHALRISAVKPDSGSSATKMTNYNIAYIRPPAPDLIAPSSYTNNGTWWNNRTIHFEWKQTLRTDNYTLRVSTNSDPWSDPSPILNQALGSGVTSYDHTFSQDYGQLYWSLRASNTAGSADSGGNIWFGIDKVKPACQVQALPSATYSNVFQVNWNSTDNSAGVQSADIQFMDSQRGTWEDWLTGVPSDKTYDLFSGQPGHTYFFRCRAMDKAGNIGDYPASADTSINIDPFSLPGTPWWDHAYGAKRNIVLLNNMPGSPLPQGYPIHLHFDGSTTPTAATLYDASLSNPKCNDLRIIYNDSIELNRVVDRCTSTAIDFWFRTEVGISGGALNNTAHQLYFGNPSAANPPTDRNHIFYPALDANHMRVFDMREGAGSNLSDATGNGSATMGPELSWTTSGKFGPAVLIPGDQTPEPRYAIYAGYGPQPSCDFTAELWLKRLTGHQYGGQLIQQEIGYSNPWRWIFALNGDKLRLSKEGVSDAVESNGSLGASTFFNNWHHIAVTYNCNGQVRFYIDGVLDSIKNFSAGGLSSASAPLRIGNSAYNSSRLAGYVSGVALSNVVRTDFSYGSFAAITNEPSVATDSVITPPVTGAPDLVILSLASYPNPGGGILIEAVVENQGDLSTQSGFYTDLYLNHVPTGPNDYSGSLRFWVNDPIAPGETVTLTTVITDLSSTLDRATNDRSKPRVSGTITENSGTLYAQTDSAGLVQEPNNQNNIYSIGVQVCTASADAYEADDSFNTATSILKDVLQTHNFDTPGDRDWVKFSAQAGKTYRLTTSGLGLSSDTYLYLYNTNGTTLIASNDDFNNTLASQIEWTAPQNGAYYVRIKHWNPNAGGCGTSYNIVLSEVTASKPGAFNKLTPSNAAVNRPVNLTLSWETSAGATRYEYCYDTTNDNACSPWVNNGTSTSKSLTGLAYNTSYYWHVRARNANGVTNSNGSFWLFKTKTQSSTFRSIATQDGWILEFAENRNVGGTMNSTATTLQLGDDVMRRQYRSILSFNTSSLPDTAVITKVTLKVRRQGVIGGGNPVTIFQGFMTDIKRGIFGTSALQLTDWQAAAQKTIGPFTPSLSGGWYTLNLTSAKAYINKLSTSGGLTQIRLRFKLDDNNNAIANYLSLYSGNAGAASRPKLIIEYYVP